MVVDEVLERNSFKQSLWLKKKYFDSPKRNQAKKEFEKTAKTYSITQLVESQRKTHGTD